MESSSIKKELNRFNVFIEKNNKVTILINGERKTLRYDSACSYLRKKINKNIKILENLFDMIFKSLDLDYNNSEKLLDSNIEEIFINQLKDLYRLFSIGDKFKGSDYQSKMLYFLQKPISEWTMDQINILIDCKISIDYLMMENRNDKYIINLIYYYYKNNKIKKEAISGPWVNFDVPIEERKINGNEIFPSEQQRGIDRQHAYRYRKGLERYNNDPRVGQGHYWREIQNEPYLWADRKFESPYPSREYLYKDN